VELQERNCEIRVGPIPKIPSSVGDYLRGIQQHSSREDDWPPSIVFLPITGVVCEDLFQFRVPENQYDTWKQRLCDRALGYSLSESTALQVQFSEYGGDTLAGLIDDWLCDSTNGLDRLLEDQAERLRYAFDLACIAAREEKDAGWDCVRSRWSSSSAEPEKSES
jgi:hypothetical protein